MMLNVLSSVSCPLSSSIQKLGKINTPPHLVSKISFPFDGKITTTRSYVGKMLIQCNIGYPKFKTPCHPHKVSSSSSSSGIGILEYFKGKNILITGATGFVGKAFVEKLLRATEVNKLYILIKAEDENAASQRLTKEIVDFELFKCLREKHGDYFGAFVREKLIPVAGNICKANLGMGSNSARLIMENVDVIVDSAAITALNDRYDVLLEHNAHAPQRMVRFAKTCKNLKIFVHFSTAYVSGCKEGLIFEEPVISDLNLVDEMSLAMKSFRASAGTLDTTKHLKELGLQRAKLFGWHNSYQMTKAIGEMVLTETREDVPILIIRPSIIESCRKEPFPGWIQGNRMFDPVIISYGNGRLPAFLADPQAHLDIIPVDMVVNSTIAAIAKHGVMNKPQVNIYHAVTGVVNPLRFSEFFDIIHEYFATNPLLNNVNLSKMKLLDNFDDLSKFTRTKILNGNGTGPHQMDDTKGKDTRSKAKIAYAEQLCKMAEFIGFYKGRFHTGNTEKLLQEMSEEERLEFDVDAMNIDWWKYFHEIHIPGLRKHVIQSR